jgi:RNA polymerase sigma factor (sigma-70 family)
MYKDYAVHLHPEDQLLLNGLAQQDPRSVDRIYRENFPSILHMVTQNNGSADDAADLFQEAMVVLYEKSTQADFQLSSSIRTYLYAVCRRMWLKRLKKDQKNLSFEDGIFDQPSLDDDLAERQQSEQRFQIMEKAMSNLGEPCRSLLEAYYIKKWPMQQIADVFKYTNADNAKTQKYKCLVRLKKLFFADYKAN